MEGWLEALHDDGTFNATFNATYKTWLATLPRQGDIMSADGMTDEEISMLQGGPLVSRLTEEGLMACCLCTALSHRK